MVYYYYYQRHRTPSGSLSPVTIASDMTPSLPPLLLLSQQQQQQQQQLTLPLVTPILPSVTTSLPMTTTAATIEFSQQQQLLTPKLSPFLRHCEETGLFQDLRNIGAMPSLTGPPGETSIITVPVTTTATMVSTRSTELPSNSSIFNLSSSGILTRMSNPFEETFKQAVLQKQNCDSKLAENLFSVNNDTNGDLNTPFISTTTLVNSSNNHINSSLTMAALPVDMITTAVVADPITVESVTSNSSTIVQPQNQNLYMTTSATESTSGNMLEMMMEQQQQQHNSIISLNPQNLQHHQSSEQCQKFIIPTSTNIASGTCTTSNIHDKDYNNSKGDKGENDKAILVEKETITIKQTLKQNLLVKRQLQERQKYPLVLETHHNSEQLQLDNLDIDISTTDVTTENKKNSYDHVQEEDSNQKQQLQQKHKQELLERNRSAAKRCRLKRKQRWELLSEENRRLKIENSRLRDILAKLISSGYGGHQQTTILQVQQGQKQLHQKEN